MLNLSFIDTDVELEKRYPTEKKVYDIHQEIGEASFRHLEKDVVLSYANQSNILLSTGGGTVLIEETRLLLKEIGRVVYLKAGLETLLERMRKRRFPNYLATPDPLSTFKEIAKIRAPLYEEIADMTIETDHVSLDHLVEKICGWYGK